MKETISDLLTRRSVRAYTSRQIEDDVLDTILEAGVYAPTGRGVQGTVMVAVRDKATRDLISRLNGAVMGTDSDPFYGAPCVIVVFEDPDITACHTYDGPLTMGNLLNAAHALGVSSCWIHRAKEVFASEEGKALLRAWGLKENLVGIGNCILGYCDGEEPQPRPRREGRIVKV